MLFDDPLQLVVPVDHPLTRNDCVTLADAIDDDWIGGPVGGSYHQIVLLACHQAGFTPRFVHRALDWSAYIALVSAGLGIALLPRLAVPATGHIHRLALTNRPMPARRILTCVRRGSQHRPAIRRLRLALHASAEPYLQGDDTP